MNRNKIKFYKIGIEHISKQGNLKYLTLFLKLKKEYTSGHFHSFKKKPNWYPGKEQTFRNHINWMIKEGWVRKEDLGFRLISSIELYKISTPTKYHKHYFFKDNQKVGFDNINFEDLFLLLQKQVIVMNYQKQIHNIAELKVARDNSLIKGTSSYEKQLKLQKNAIYCNVSLVADCKSKNTTSLSCRGLGKLFGKQTNFGFKLFNELIEEDFVTRKKDYKLIPAILADDLEEWQKAIPHKTFFKNGRYIYKCKTTFMINSFRNKEEESKLKEVKEKFKTTPLFKTPQQPLPHNISPQNNKET